MILRRAKQQLRVMQGLDDRLIQHYLDAAVDHIGEYLGDDLPDPMPEDIQCAVLLLTGDLYVNRDHPIDRPIHHCTAYQLLLAPYRPVEMTR